MQASLGPIQRWMQKAVRLCLTLTITSGVVYGTGIDSNPLPPSITSAPLSVDQVVSNVVGKDIERARALRHSDSNRIYRLSYHGFPGDREAEMTVEATYDSPASKSFKVISQTGSKLVVDRVFKRLLESEREAAEPEMHARTLLNRDNYEFALIGFESSDKGNQYVLAVSPKTKSKYLYRGRVWVDAAEFAVTRIDAEPAQNPSFWTKKSEIHHEYMKVQDFWLPRRNESISYIRLGGRATLTIEYNNYHVIDARAPESAQSSSAAPAR
jgi:hypothetical protein